MDSIRIAQTLRAIWVLIVAAAIVLAIIYVTPLVYPFLIGWLIAFALIPLTNVLEGKARFPRWLAVTVSLILFVGIVMALLTLIVSRIVVQIGKLVAYVEANIEGWVNNVIALIQSEQWQNTLAQFSRFYAQNERYHTTIDSNLTTLGDRVTETTTKLLTGFVTGIVNLAASLPSMAFVIIVALLAAFFIAKDWYKIKAWLKRVFPSRISQPFGTVWFGLGRALFGYLRAQLIMISITALFIMIGLMIMRVDYAVTIALLIGLVDLLPYLGTGAAMIPWIIYTFISGNIPLGIGLSILYGVVLVTRSIIEPKVLATSIGMNSLATLIAMFVGLGLFGVLGLIIGPVTLVLMLTIQKAGVFRDVWRYIQHGSTIHTGK
ncbi:sporulation integral membrane protein YtvI [Xylanibacillus composti]|uniref:Permease n=1 Tax=Xylanibacillus composti TaxID=1572762 RepID=A0A8J4H2V0_9BACL|nr:sporulation integral membrane protein YtvI [Xylanibacillus composti]GIQ69854.1 permease [Xylanibacillus composti]